MKLLLFLSLAVVLCFPAAATAQIQNGDFESGGAAWTPDAPTAWTVDYPTTQGNPGGYLWIMSPFGNSAGTGCAFQEFSCGGADTSSTCTITFDYRLDFVDASDSTAFVTVLVDSTGSFTSPLGTFQGIPWTHREITVPCGPHTIRLCLNVEPGNNGWSACFDNVTAACSGTVPVHPMSWGGIKLREGS